MIGTNKLYLNQSQMDDAIEYYLKNVMLKDDKFQVTGVSENKSSGYFEISLEGPAHAEKGN
jgi:hypothetical protein